jgi:hypothetical protein
MTSAISGEELAAIQKAMWKQFRIRKRDGYFRGVAFNAYAVPRWFFWPIGYVKFGGQYIARNQLQAMIQVINGRLHAKGRDLVITMENFIQYDQQIAACK